MRYRSFCIGLVACLLCVSALGQQFGHAGYEGHGGHPGIDGRPGRDATVMADGNPYNIQAFGTDGEDGHDGDRGHDASNCSQPMNVPYHLQGAPGGRGGSGGRGGHGGAGGDITVHFADISHLKRIYVNAGGGRGGRAGHGDFGGRGCYCSLGSWQITTGETTQTYTCQNGNQGEEGYDGSSGNQGAYGQVTIISQLDPVAPAHNQVTVKMEEMEKLPHRLSLNHWENRTGARALFATGSDLSNSYRYYAGRTDVDYSLLWKAQRPVTDFSGKSISLTLNTDKKVSISLPSGVWASGEYAADGSGFTFLKALFSSEAMNLSFAGVTGSGAELTAQIKDNANVTDLLETTYTMEYYTRYNYRWIRRFSGTVPAAAITSAADGHRIAIGSMTIDPKYTAIGVRTFIRFYAKRRLGNFSSTKELGIDYTIK